MKQLASTLPDFVSEIAEILNEENLQNLSAQLPTAEIERCSYDRSVNAGYIYLVRPTYLKDSPPVFAETFAYAGPHWFNIDVDVHGNILGIELLSRNDVFDKLRDANVL